MSPRAAWRLESLLFDQVYDYVAGKEDWASAGFPVEGEAAAHPTPLANEVVNQNVPTCREYDRLRNVRNAPDLENNDGCLVLNGEDVVLGRITKRAFDHPDDTPVQQVMDPGPATIRPGTSLEDIASRMKNAQVGDILVTTAEGKFVGILHLADAEQELARTIAQHSGPG